MEIDNNPVDFHGHCFSRNGPRTKSIAARPRTTAPRQNGNSGTQHKTRRGIADRKSHN